VFGEVLFEHARRTDENTETPVRTVEVTYEIRVMELLSIIQRRCGCEGARGSVAVEALCYKPEGRGFKSRQGGFFQLT
jgi:hypothetical protein